MAFIQFGLSRSATRSPYVLLNLPAAIRTYLVSGERPATQFTRDDAIFRAHSSSALLTMIDIARAQAIGNLAIMRHLLTAVESRDRKQVQEAARYLKATIWFFQSRDKCDLPGSNREEFDQT